VAPPVEGPYELLLWEQVGYLVDDARRLDAFRLLGRRVGTEPGDILRAPVAALEAVARAGGAIAVSTRAARIRQVAEMTVTRHAGDLRTVLSLPLADARRELARYPAIGPPGAERILLLSGSHPVLALESNGLRVLLRLGYGREEARYAHSHRSAQAAASVELPETVDARRDAHLLLRRHGESVCRRSRPACLECPLAPDCPAASIQGA
jgi:endonuclease-3